MNVLIASFTFPPNRDGVSAAAELMATGFAQRGWTVDVATEPATDLRPQLHQRIRVHEFNIRGGLHPRNPFTGDVEEYRLFLLSDHWDVIVFHSYAWTVYVAAPLLPSLRAKKILVSHGFGALIWTRRRRFPYGLGSWFLSAYQSVIALKWMRSIDRLVVLSNRVDFGTFYDHLLAKAAGRPPIAVIPNGVDLDETCLGNSNFRERIGAGVDTFVFLCVAHYSERKDQGYAARAFRRAGLENALLVFIGPEFNEFSERFRAEDARLASPCELKRIVWMEKQNRRDTVGALETCDAFVLSAKHEAQPIAILEAMRSGKPWISRNAGCVSEIPGGLVVRSERQMCRAMRDLARKPRLCSELGTEGLEAVRSTFNRSEYLRAYCQILEKVTSV